MLNELKDAQMAQLNYKIASRKKEGRMGNIGMSASGGDKSHLEHD